MMAKNYTNYISLVLDSSPDDVDAAMLIDADLPNRSFSWSQYVLMLKCVAVGLRELGLQEGDGVGMVSDNDIYYHVLGDGVQAAGGVFVAVPTLGKQADMGNNIRVGQISWLFAAPKYLEIARLACKEAGLDDSRLLAFDPPELEPYSGPRRTFSQLLKSDASAWSLPLCASNGETIAHRGFTSGTTGAPKAAELNHRIVVDRLQAMTVLLPVSPGPLSKVFHNVQLYHPTGFAQFARAALGQAVLYLSSDMTPTGVLDKIQHFGLQSIYFNPRGMDVTVDVIKTGKRSPDCLKTVRSVVVSGGSSRLDTLELMQSYIPKGAVMMDAYGSTECGGISGMVLFPENKPPFSGIPMPGNEVKIIDFETLEKVPDDAPGEICVRSPHLICGYAGNPAATKAAFLEDADGKGHWYRTGDKGYISSVTGRLAIIGRFKEVFKIGYLGVSEEVAPAEVEDELKKIPGVDDAALVPVVSRSNPADHEPLAYVVRRDGATLTAQQVVDYVDSRMARHKVPVGGVLFVRELPRNVFGKVVRRQLDELELLGGSERYLSVSE